MLSWIEYELHTKRKHLLHTYIKNSEQQSDKEDWWFLSVATFCSHQKELFTGSHAYIPRTTNTAATS